MAEYRINPGQKVLFPCEHRYLRMNFASMPVEIYTRTMSPFEVKNREIVDMEKGGETVTIENRNSFLVVIKVDSLPRKIAGIDEVNLADGTSVTLAPGSTLDVGEVTMSPTAEITIKAGSDIAVNNFPAEFGVNNFPSFPTEFAVNNLQTEIAVNNFPAEFGIKSAATATGLTPITFDTSAKTIALNANRKELHLKAKSTNTEDIYLFSSDGLTGIPLEPGQATVLNTTALIDVYCTDTTAILYCAEFE